MCARRVCASAPVCARAIPRVCACVCVRVCGVRSATGAKGRARGGGKRTCDTCNLRASLSSVRPYTHIYVIHIIYIYTRPYLYIIYECIYIYIYQTRVFPAPHHPVDRTVADDDGDGFFFLSTPPHTRRSRRPPYIVAYPPIVCAGGGVKYGTTERYR